MNYFSRTSIAACVLMMGCTGSGVIQWKEIREARSVVPSRVIIKIKKVPAHANSDALEIAVDVFAHNIPLFRESPIIAENYWLYLVEDEHYALRNGWLEGNAFPDVPSEVLQAAGNGVAAIIRWTEHNPGTIELNLRLVGFDGDLELWNITRKLVGSDGETFVVETEN